MTDISTANIAHFTADQALFSAGEAAANAKVDMKAKNMAKVDKTAKDFESVFLGQMLQPMFNTVPVDPEMGGGSAEEIYRSMLCDEYGKLIAQGGGIGIAAQVKKEILSIQAKEGK